jgi:cbb3-type cytochrome oxidase subunit 3
MKKILRGAVLVIALTFMQNIESNAQCPMCRTGLESNLKNGGTMGRGINTGILMLFAMPYILVAGIAYMWVKNKKGSEDQEIEEEISTIA